MKKIISLCILLLVVIGCSKSDNYVKEMYEKYNGMDSYVDVKIGEDSILFLANDDKVREIFDSSGVIFVGDSKSNISRVCMNVLLNVVDSTNLDVIYYSENIDVVSDYVEDVSVPVILFVYEGEVKSYHVGTVDGKVDLTEDEELDLYNIYMDGIHSVLNDMCDERC